MAMLMQPADEVPDEVRSELPQIDFVDPRALVVEPEPEPVVVVPDEVEAPTPLHVMTENEFQAIEQQHVGALAAQQQQHAYAQAELVARLQHVEQERAGMMAAMQQTTRYARSNDVRPVKGRTLDLGKCAVCHESVSASGSRTTLNCGLRHIFHAACLYHFVSTYENRCPACTRIQLAAQYVGGDDLPPLDFGDSMSARERIDRQKMAVADYRTHCIPDVSVGARRSAQGREQHRRQVASGVAADGGGGGGTLASAIAARLGALWFWRRGADDDVGAVPGAGARQQREALAARGNPYEMLMGRVPSHSLVAYASRRAILDDRRILVDTFLSNEYGVDELYLLELTWDDIFHTMQLKHTHLRHPGVLGKLVELYQIRLRHVFAVCENSIDTLASLNDPAYDAPTMPYAMLAALGATFDELVRVGMTGAHMASAFRFSIDSWTSYLGLERGHLGALKQIGVTYETAARMSWGAIEFHNTFGVSIERAFPSGAINAALAVAVGVQERAPPSPVAAQHRPGHVPIRIPGSRAAMQQQRREQRRHPNM